MAFNKSKALENALKLLNQGKTAQAINEYQQILRHDPKDQATLMTVGDLFARQGDMKQAAEYFERLAQVYLNDGFNSKAIAIYKKIAKLAPTELAPLERLADLYVQQGVLSEARPLFLQIAEAHLKANRAPKALEVLHRLLDVEPDNPRVQMRLAELHNVMGQKKEAAQTYYNYAQRLHERGETEEAQKLIDRALEVDPTNAAALFLRARILAAAGKPERAAAILENHPQADAGGEVTDLLIELDLTTGQNEKAADRARNQLVRGSSHFGPLLRVADYLIDNGEPAEALPLLGELRDPIIEVNAHEAFLNALAKVGEKLPGNIEALEMTAAFCRHTSDPFHLSASLTQLIEIYDQAGDKKRAEELLLELIDRNKGDERLLVRLQNLRGQSGLGSGLEMDLGKPLEEQAEIPVQVGEPAQTADSEESISAIAASSAAEEESLDEEAQKYIAQALTDVDLFSSYGLVQKAMHLLENILERAPRHAPALERLLDLQVGSGNARRTAELAAILEKIHRERGDGVNADRFGELREQFRVEAGVSDEDLNELAEQAAAVPPIAAKQGAAPFTPIATSAPLAETPATLENFEFEIPLTSIEPEEPIQEPLQNAHHASSAEMATPKPRTGEEVDLSDEWAAMVQGSADSAEMAEPPSEPAMAAAAAQQADTPATPPQPVTHEVSAAGESQEIRESEEEKADEFVLNGDEMEVEIVEIEAAAPEPLVIQSDEELDPALSPAAQVEQAESEPQIPTLEATPFEPQWRDELPVEGAETRAESPTFIEPAVEREQEPLVEAGDAGEDGPEILSVEPFSAAGEPRSTQEFELELKPVEAKTGPATAEDFLSELVAEVEELEMPEAPAKQAEPPQWQESVAAQASAPEPMAESLNELAEVFQEFRSELGEITEENEDLETHYNLGIAYREMGLLDEAIGEFQKVAKAVLNGHPFRYAMNCSTLLALCFMEKGDPKIAALWYRRALDTPGLDAETILALRYDLGVSLETAGESPAALDIFRQVYAMNIDYRDVADHIATLRRV